MRALVLALLLSLIPACATAQQTVTITELVPGAGVRELWVKVLSCAGSLHDTTKTFEQIRFFERDSTYDAAGDLVLGEWAPPDTIFLTSGFERIGWIVAHEMLHHALNGPPGGNPHPLDPFMFPCGLMEFQQYSGGMNGGTVLPTKYKLEE